MTTGNLKLIGINFELVHSVDVDSILNDGFKREKNYS